ncbi:pilus assembly protein [Novosphingobium sp. 1949]|uniref:Pilus assembly protein n=1 Tax=Novosphingobium organovorum TaxID=2930092 RepID=A0ABT0B983_9SPHN|nr:pilus assembly protein [Novosphingobium organovorum]MCJ2181616.1 pilus assembly protein [Novosphingobium organovorum]
MKLSVVRALGRIIRDKRGNILPLAAIGMVLLTAMIGGGVDFSRVYRARNQLQAACDAGVLAGRHAVTTDGYDADAEAEADKFFEVNFTFGDGATFTSSSDDDGNNVEGVASYTVNLLIMRLFGFNSFALTTNCTASMGVGNADVMMVLDTTGSMTTALGSTTRIAALRTAMKNFYSTLSGSLGDSNARVRYGFVPYSTTVNVGHLLYNLNPDYIADTHTYQSRVPYFIDYSTATETGSSTSTGSSSLSSSGRYSNTSYSSQSSCESALPTSDTSYSDSGSASTSTSTSSSSDTSVTVTQTSSQPQTMTTYACVASSSGGGGYGHGSSSTKYYIYYYTYTRTSKTTTTYSASYTNTPTSNSTFDHWKYMAVDYDTSTFKTFASTTTYTGSSGASVSSTWDGCIEERATEAADADDIDWSSSDGYSPSGMLDMDIDTAPDESDDSTKWAPLWYQIVYTRAGTSTSNTNSFSLATSTTGSSSTVSETCPYASQGLEEMSQSDFDAYADSLTASGNTYLDVGMAWGGRLLSPDGIFSSTVNEEPSNGAEVSRHIIFMTDGEMQTALTVSSAWGVEWFNRLVTDSGGSASQSDDRHTARFLAECKAIKAKGIRIWVIAFTSSLSDDLTTCASDDSSFTASSSSDLNDAFQEIAKEVGELRIVS